MTTIKIFRSRCSKILTCVITNRNTIADTAISSNHIESSIPQLQSICTKYVYLSIKAFVPSNTDPIGAAKDLLKQKQTLSISLTILLNSTLLATAAFTTLAPSICTAIPCDLAMLLNLSNHSKGKTCSNIIVILKHIHDIAYKCARYVKCDH